MMKNADKSPPPSAILVTGMSGAGKSSALKALEDLGFEAIDNVPLSLLGNLVSPASRAEGSAGRLLAMGIDIRTREFSADRLIEQMNNLTSDDGLPVRMVFLDCDDDILANRFTETRRRHPLAADRPVADGILMERQQILPLRDQADLVIDTTGKTLGDLKAALQTYLSVSDDAGLSIFVTSFSFAKGLPREADIVFDVRFLNNPHYDKNLKSLTGRDQPVGAFIADDPAFPSFWISLTALLAPLLPRYLAEGKSYLTIAVGCTGGRHRSVFIAERLRVWFEEIGHRIHLTHRDLDQD